MSKHADGFTLAHIGAALTAGQATLSPALAALVGAAKRDSAAIYERALARCTVDAAAAEDFMSSLEATPVADQSPLAAFRRRCRR